MAVKVDQHLVVSDLASTSLIIQNVYYANRNYKKKGVRVRDSLPSSDDKSDDQPNDQSTYDHVAERDGKACAAYQNKHYSECRQTQQCDQSYDKRNHNFILL